MEIWMNNFEFTLLEIPKMIPISLYSSQIYIDNKLFRGLAALNQTFAPAIELPILLQFLTL